MTSANTGKLKVAESVRDKKRKADQDAKDELQRVKLEAKRAADAIKKRKMDQQMDIVPAIFTADAPADVFTTVAEVAEPAKHPEWTKPWVCKGGVCLDACLGDTVVQRSLASWGSQYKKTMNRAKPKITQTSYPMEDKMGRGLVNALLDQLLPAGDRPDLTPAAGGKLFMESAWLFGVSTDHRSVSFQPNHASSIRVLSVGTVRYILIKWRSLRQALDAAKQQSAESVIQKLKSLSPAELTELAKIVPMCQCSLTAQMVLYVPTGWLVVEIASNFNCPLIYGFRTGFFSFHDALVQYYQDAIELLKGEPNSSTSRMEQILAVLKKEKQDAQNPV